MVVAFKGPMAGGSARDILCIPVPLKGEAIWNYQVVTGAAWMWPSNLPVGTWTPPSPSIFPQGWRQARAQLFYRLGKQNKKSTWDPLIDKKRLAMHISWFDGSMIFNGSKNGWDVKRMNCTAEFEHQGKVNDRDGFRYLVLRKLGQ